METKKLGDVLLIHDKMENVLKNMKDSSVDMVISDPPFGVRKTTSENYGWKEFDKIPSEWVKEYVNKKKM